MKEASLKAAEYTLEIESRAITQIADYLDRDSFEKAVLLLSSCGKIATCASGHSGIAAKHFSHAMNCIDRPSAFLSPAEAIHGGSGYLEKGDAIVFVSRGGKTAELLPIIDISITRGAKVIAVTENLESPLAKKADIVLPLKIEREADKYNMMATTSFVATVALFDALWMAVMEEIDYKKEQFGIIHPGGAVGERLNK